MLGTVAYSDDLNYIEENRFQLLIPCKQDQEKCMPYFRNMLQYLRTYTLKYKITKVTNKDQLKTIFITFTEGDLCRPFLVRAEQDLKSLDVHLEKKYQEHQFYWLLYNLNHRLIMACISPKQIDKLETK